GCFFLTLWQLVISNVTNGCKSLKESTLSKDDIDSAVIHLFYLFLLGLRNNRVCLISSILMSVSLDNSVHIRHNDFILLIVRVNDSCIIRDILALTGQFIELFAGICLANSSNLKV